MSCKECKAQLFREEQTVSCCVFLANDLKFWYYAALIELRWRYYGII